VTSSTPQGSTIDRAIDWAFAHSVPLTRTRALVGGALAVSFITLLDILVGPQVEFTALYAVPVAVVSWSAGRRIGLAMCAITAAASGAAEVYVDPGASPLWVLALMAATRFGALALIALAFASIRVALHRLSDLAEHDPLTRLLNRRALFERLRAEIARGERHPEDLTVLYFDVDDFKAINDRDGHEAGDRLLRDLAAAMTGMLRPEDICARVGGDEFVGVLPQTGAEGAKAGATRLLERLNDTAAAYDSSVSLGVVTFHSPPASVDSAISYADREMYRAKHAGTGQVRFLILE